MKFKKRSPEVATKEPAPALNRAQMVNNATTLYRAELMRAMFDPRRDIDAECGYPTDISEAEYAKLYSREGVAARCVSVWPEESWSIPPEIYETEDSSVNTEFENAWAELNKKRQCLQYLARIDTLSGVGRFGILLLGLDDGKALSEPADGLDENGNPVGKPKHQLIYLRAFQESVVSIAAFNTDVTSPRFGQPVLYSVQFSEGTETVSGTIHWTRVIHVADNREMSEVYGIPRMQHVFNRLLDIRKITGGSGEMFWKGGFPGLAFEMNPDQMDVEIDQESIRQEFANYSNGLQRYLSVVGMTAKSLAPQVADPKGHLEAQMTQIAISLAIPQRVLFGSEQAQLASGQDAKTWARRVSGRQTKYLTPMLVEPFLQRLVDLGCLPEPKEIIIQWPDLLSMSDMEKAELAKAWAEGLSKYVAGNVNQLVPPEEFLSIFAGLNQDQIEAIMKSAMEYLAKMEEQADEEPEATPEGEPGEEIPEPEQVEDEGELPEEEPVPVKAPKKGKVKTNG